MKKIVAGIIASFLMASGLVAIAAGSASSAPPRCPYTGCVNTDVSGKAVSPNGTRKVRVTYNVGTQGNATPRGVVRVIVKGNGTFRAKNRRYPRQQRVVFVKVPRGSYQVFIKYIPGRNTPFQRSRQDTLVTVR